MNHRFNRSTGKFNKSTNTKTIFGIGCGGCLFQLFFMIGLLCFLVWGFGKLSKTKVGHVVSDTTTEWLSAENDSTIVEE